MTTYRKPTAASDIYSVEFADWMADQYRLAMLKGIDLAKQAMRGSHAI